MREVPRVHYVRNGDVNIAYVVAGDGPVDLLFVGGWFSHQEMLWEAPNSRAFFAGLAKRFRLISYDKRGTGMSDPLDDAGAYTDRIDDLRVVMDAAGAERPVVCGLSEGGILSAIFAATEPERVRSLILLNMPLTPATLLEVDDARDQLRDGWGEGALYELFLPEVPDTPESRELWARTQRQSASRGLALQYFDQISRLDARPVLPAVSVPTLVLRGRHDLLATHKDAVATAAAVPGATLKEVDCGHIPWLTGGAQVVSAITEFVTGAPAPVPAQRRLATVLFTDIVDSTARATSLGDRAWRSLLDRHDDAVRAELDRFSGREVKSTGDGFLAAFDGPAEAIAGATSARAATEAIGVSTRAGIHTGQCEVRGEDLGGIAVHIGARVAALARPGEVLVSRTVRDLVAGSDVRLEDRGEHTLKGVPEPWRVYAVS
ncbi:MAG: adenylate/guanylate cyclase domain-containing protein [Solirubrobacteraceae bacterium]